MKYFFLLIASVILSSGFSYGQEQSAGKKLYNPMFKWRINIPEGFENMSPQEYAGMQKKGADAIEKTPANVHGAWKEVASGIYKLADELLMIVDVKMMLSL